jgi:glycosyltransferase involved in cell wall biosynthesis
VRDNWSCFPAILTARALGYRVVVQVDGIPYGGVSDDVPPVLDLVKRAVAIAIGRLSQGQLAVTPQIKSLLVDLARVPPERVAVIGNGVDLDFFAPLPRGEAIARLGLDLDRRYLDFYAILEAFAAVRAVHPETHLVLVGDGPERPAIEAHAARLGIGDGFTITGMLGDRERVRDFLAAATITLLAYRPERVGVTSASPIKLTEYLSMGRAVVAVEIPGVRELVEETGAGIVIDDGAPAMTSAILELLSGDCADRCGAAGRAVAEARLSWQSVIDRTLSLFDR